MMCERKGRAARNNGIDRWFKEGVEERPPFRTCFKMFFSASWSRGRIVFTSIFCFPEADKCKRARIVMLCVAKKRVQVSSSVERMFASNAVRKSACLGAIQDAFSALPLQFFLVCECGVGSSIQRHGDGSASK
jgi:hypothetical protein